MLFERTALSRKPAKLAEMELKQLREEGKLTPDLVFRDPYPHLDLGSFAKAPHAKHFCGNCGNDSVWSEGKIVSTPLKPLHDQFNNSNSYITPDRSINLDEYSGKRCFTAMGIARRSVILQPTVVV